MEQQQMTALIARVEAGTSTADEVADLIARVDAGDADAAEFADLLIRADAGDKEAEDLLAKESAKVLAEIAGIEWDEDEYNGFQ